MNFLDFAFYSSIMTSSFDHERVCDNDKQVEVRVIFSEPNPSAARSNSAPIHLWFLPRFDSKSVAHFQLKSFD
jgi:hypothetical protein